MMEKLPKTPFPRAMPWFRDISLGAVAMRPVRGAYPNSVPAVQIAPIQDRVVAPWLPTGVGPGTLLPFVASSHCRMRLVPDFVGHDALGHENMGGNSYPSLFKASGMATGLDAALTDAYTTIPLGGLSARGVIRPFSSGSSNADVTGAVAAPVTADVLTASTTAPNATGRASRLEYRPCVALVLCVKHVFTVSSGAWPAEPDSSTSTDLVAHAVAYLSPEEPDVLAPWRCASSTAAAEIAIGLWPSTQPALGLATLTSATPTSQTDSDPVSITDGEYVNFSLYALLLDPRPPWFFDPNVPFPEIASTETATYRSVQLKLETPVSLGDELDFIKGLSDE